VGVIPGTDWLLFASNRRGRLDLWGVPFREGKALATPILVEQGIGRFFPLGFTNDGRYYYATLSVTDDVFLADFDPESGRIIGAPRKLASQWEGANMNARFSPDGNHLAYVTRRGPMPIPTHTADSLVLQSLKDVKADPIIIGFEEFGLTRAEGPCWADDGRSVVVGGFRGRESGLYRVDLPSLKKTKIYSAPEGRQITNHGCASNGRFAYLVAGARDQSGVVTRIDLDGGDAKELYKAPPGRSSIALSADGKTLSIIQSVDRNRRALLLMPTQGGAARQIHEFVQLTGGGVSQTWSPDGKSIYYIVRRPQPDSEKWHWVIARIPVDGGKASEQSFEFGHPLFYLQFSPNGRLVSFTGRSGASTESEVWVIENLKDELKALLPAQGEKP
jgi:Tol biopolymer transport system component